MSRTRPTYLYSILSVALVLFILGFFALMTLHGRSLVTLFKEKIDLWLELRPGTGQEDVARIVANIRQQAFVKKETVTFVSREQAATAMKEDLGDESLLEDTPDLLRDVIRFNIKAEFMEDARLADWREALKQDSLIADLYFEAANTANVGQNLQKMGYIALALSLMLIFAAVTLIHNTIRLALYSNRFIIKNQELVGASWEFISRPYVRRGMLNGVLSGLLAIAMLILLNWWLYRVMPELELLQDLDGTLVVYIGILVLGVLISGLSTWFVVHKFLKMRIDDLY